MYSYMLQDWTTVNVSAQLVDIVQSEVDWMSFQPYQDIIVWVETRAANAVRRQVIHPGLFKQFTHRPSALS